MLDINNLWEILSSEIMKGMRPFSSNREQLLFPLIYLSVICKIK